MVLFCDHCSPLPEWVGGWVDGGGEEGRTGGQGRAGDRQLEQQPTRGQVSHHHQQQQHAPAPGGQQRQGAPWLKQGFKKKEENNV